jgi:hypothetical protein
MKLSKKECKFLQEYLSIELTHTRSNIQTIMMSKTSLAEEVKKTVDNVEILSIIVHKIEKFLGESNV